MADWYPGDDYVDVLAVDGYNWGCATSAGEWTPPHELFDSALIELDALNVDKPILIAEVACAERGGCKADWIAEFVGYAAAAKGRRVRLVRTRQRNRLADRQQRGGSAGDGRRAREAGGVARGGVMTADVVSGGYVLAPETEDARMRSVEQLQLLGSAQEERFARITRMARQVFGVPMAAVSLLDRDSQWFKQNDGLDLAGTIPREQTICRATIARVYQDVEEPALIIGDTRKAPDFCELPAVKKEGGVRFYAGYPLFGPGGHAVGAFCLYDTKPRSLSCSSGSPDTCEPWKTESSARCTPPTRSSNRRADTWSRTSRRRRRWTRSGTRFHNARRELRQGRHLADITYDFQQRVDAAARAVVDSHVSSMRADIEEIAALTSTPKRSPPQSYSTTRHWRHWRAANGHRSGRSSRFGR